MTTVLAKRFQANADREVTYEPIESTDGLLSTVYNVEICATGIEYPLASGPMTFTSEDLVQAVAAQNDPAIQSPRVWLGHPDDDRFHAGRTTPAGSAEPALGKVVDMRVEDDGQVLVGDIAGCPTWLAKILSSAYPSRSVEGFKDAKTVTGHEWQLVVTDLALLGVTWPGVSTLEDLQALYSENGPEGVTVEEGDMAVAAARSVNAQVNIDDVRRAFYSALGEMDISSWSWIRAIQLDPNELIVDDDEGDLYAITFDTGKDPIEFGEPVKKKIEYVNASQKKDPQSRALLTAAFTHGHTVAASWTDRTESRPENTNQEDAMTPEEIRASIGLPADATDDQVRTRLTELQAASVGPQGTQATDPTANPSPDQDPNHPDHEPADPPPPPNSGTPAAASAAPPGYVSVPADAWAQVQANAAAGAAVAQQSETQRRAGIIEAAVQQGRIAPSQRDNFRRLFESDPQGAENLLTASVDKGGLLPGTIPVQARGTDPSLNSLTIEAYPQEWLPELHRPGASPVVTVED